MITKKIVAKGVIWSLLDTFANFAIKFFFALAITRILSPRDFGIVAYMGLFLGVASWLSEGGFGNALIQKKEANDTDFSTAYFFNVGVSLFFFIGYFLAAPLVAVFFKEPELVFVMRVISVGLVLNALCYIHLIKLIKSVHFKEPALLNFLVSTISGIIALIMAWKGFGYWALIFQTLLGSLLKMFGLWMIVKWKPVLAFSWASFREQFKFGSKIFTQGLLDSIFRELHSVVIGKHYLTNSLGFYSRGQRFFELFIVQIGTAVNKVLYPSMTGKNEDAEASKLTYNKIYSLLFFIMAPLSLFFLTMAEPLVKILLTEKWLGAVPVMRLYFIAGFIYTLVSYNGTTLLVANRPALFLGMDIMQKTMMAIALILTFTISIQAIVIGWLVVYYLYFGLYEWIIYRLNYTRMGKYRSMGEVMVCLIPVLFLHYLLRSLVEDDWSLLLLNVILQPLTYLFTMRIFRIPVFREFSLVIKSLLPGRYHFLFSA